MSQQRNRSNLRCCALCIGYALLVFCGLLVAPLYAIDDDLPSAWQAVSIAGLIVSLPISLLWVPIASYDPVEIIPSPAIVIAFHVIGTAVFTLVQLAVIGTIWYLVRRSRRSRSGREGECVASTRGYEHASGNGPGEITDDAKWVAARPPTQGCPR